METSEPTEATPELTDEQRQTMYDWINAHPYGEQDENGIDLSLLRANLRLTPTQRLHRLESAANSMQRMMRNVKRTTRT